MVPKVLTCITCVYNVYCMHDTITTVSLLENELAMSEHIGGNLLNMHGTFDPYDFQEDA